MRGKKRTLASVAAAICLSALWLVTSFNVPNALLAQHDSTAARQTLNAIVNPRLTLTARERSAFTQTAAYLLSPTFAARTAQALETQTAVFTHTPTAPPDATQQFATILANVADRLTQTAALASNSTRTAAFQGTADALFFATLGITLTPSPTALPSALPLPNATDQYATLLANVEQRLTAISAATTTFAAQATFETILNQTLGFTPTPDPNQLQSTLDAQINTLLTQTAQAVLAQTATLAFEGTLAAITHRGQTATAAAIRERLSVGFAPLSVANVAALSEVTSLFAHGAPALSLTFNGYGDQFASGGLDNTVRLFDLERRTQRYVWQGMTDRISVALSPDGTRLAASSSDGVIRLWDVPTRTEIATLQGHNRPVRKIVFSPNSRLLASGGDDGMVRLWDAHNGALLASFGEAIFRAPITALAFTSNNALLGIGSADTQLVLWEVSSRVLIARVRDQHPILDLAFSPEGLLLATVGRSNALSLWNVVGLSLRAQLPASTASLTSVALSADGSLVAAGTQEGFLVIWDVNSGQPLSVTLAHTGSLNDVLFAPNGVFVLTCGSDGLIKLWGVSEALGR